MGEERTEIRMEKLLPGARFYLTSKSRIPYRYLGKGSASFLDMHGRDYYSTYRWVREDWTGKIHYADDMTGGAPRVWV